MPFIDDNRESGCRAFSNEDWIRFVPGECPLARKVLPYLAQLHDQLVIYGQIRVVVPNLIVGIDDHDYYMTVHAVLALMMAWSINTGDTRWLENTGLMATLKGFESRDLAPYEGAERYGWKEQCMRALEQIGMVSFGCLEDRLDFRESLFVPADGWTDFNRSGNSRNSVMISRLIDGHDVQILKDVFYIVTGATTFTDGDCAVGPQEKSSRTDGIPVEGDEDLSWAPSCPTVSSAECDVGVCSHFTGLLPVIGVPVIGVEEEDGVV